MCETKNDIELTLVGFEEALAYNVALIVRYGERKYFHTKLCKITKDYILLPLEDRGFY